MRSGACGRTAEDLTLCQHKLSELEERASCNDADLQRGRCWILLQVFMGFYVDSMGDEWNILWDNGRFNGMLMVYCCDINGVLWNMIQPGFNGILMGY